MAGSVAAKGPNADKVFHHPGGCPRIKAKQQAISVPTGSDGKPTVPGRWRACTVCGGGLH